MSDLNVASQQTPVEPNELIEHLLFTNEHDTPVLEQHGIPLDPFAWFYILQLRLSQFLQRCALVRHPTSGNVPETDQHLGDNSTHAHLSFRISAQDLIQFLEHDAFTQQPSFASGNETLVEQNGTPAYLIPAAELYQFLQSYAHPASEPPPSGNGNENSAEQNVMPVSLLIPAEKLSQFLQRYNEFPEPSSFDSGDNTPAVQQPEDCSESDLTSRSATPTQFQDSDDPVDAQSDAAGCPVCNETFKRVQERNRHIESYLPHSICCPFQDCCWTGRRQSDFREHLKKKHKHPGTGQVPIAHAIELYDPREFVKKILDERPVGEVAQSAFTKAHEGFKKLAAAGMVKVGVNVLGRSRELRMWTYNPSTVISPSLQDSCQD